MGKRLSWVYSVGEIKKPKVKESKLSKAVKTLVEALKKDKDYRYSWQANIAICMQDAYDYINLEDKNNIHKISNDGAIRFLDLLEKV